MATTNHDRVGKGLELLRQGLKPFVEREMQAPYGNQWLKQAGYSAKEELRSSDDAALTDAHALLVIMWTTGTRRSRTRWDSPSAAW